MIKTTFICIALIVLFGFGLVHLDKGLRIEEELQCQEWKSWNKSCPEWQKAQCSQFEITLR